MGYSNMLEYRPNIEAAQLIGSANPFASAAKYLGDTADRIRADKVADSDIGYKNSLTKSTDDANRRAEELHPEIVKKAQKENVKLDDDHAKAAEDLRGTQFDNEFKERSMPLRITALDLGNQKLSGDIQYDKIRNKYAPQSFQADVNAKNASAYASTTGANIQKFMSLDPYGVQSAQADYYKAGGGLKKAQESKFNNQLLQ